MRRAPSRRPSDARAPKNTQNPSGGWGRAFWPGSGSLISVSKSKIPPPPVLRVPKIEKKCRFDTFFGRFSAFRNGHNAVNYSIFAVLTSFAGAMQKRRKCCKYQYFFDPKPKNHCKLQHVWQVYRKKCWYLHCFCNFKKTWKARNTVNSSVLATFGRWNAGIYRVFCPWRRQTPVNYSIFCTFWTDFLPWWTQKTLVFTRFPKKSKIVTWTKPCK